MDAPPGEELDKVVLELAREIGNVSPGVLADDQHLTEMGLGLGMAFETVLVSALFLADLAVPSKALQAFRLHLVCQVLWRSDCKT